jgi:hypothetical protein
MPWRRSSRAPSAQANRWRQQTFVVLALTLLLSACVTHPNLPEALPLTAVPVQGAERIPVTIRTSWPALLAAAESAIPMCREGTANEACPDSAPDSSFIFRSEEDWTPIDRRLLGTPLGFQASAWRREPVTATVSGSHFSASLRIQYRVRVGLVTGRQLASCGFGEAPREITVHIEGDLRFAAEWYVDPTLTVDLVPESRCTASVLNFDITDAVVGPLLEELRREADEAAKRIRELTRVREQVATAWSALNQPMSLATNLWFAFNLSRVALRPPEITPDGRYVAVKLALEGVPRVLFGPRPPAPTAPLPDLKTGEVRPEFNLKIRALITYAKASAMLRQLLEASGGPGGMRGIRIVGVEVSGRGRNVVVALEVRGLLRGTLYFFGVPHFEPRSDGAAGGTLTMEDGASFTVGTRSPLTGFLTSAFRPRIERALEDLVRWDVSPELQSATTELTSSLNRDLTPQARLVGKLSEFGPGEVRVGPEGLEAWYRLGGRVEVVINPFN